MRKVKHAAQDNGMEFLDNVTLSKRIGVYEKDELLSLYLHNVLNEYKVKMPTWADRYGDQ